MRLQFFAAKILPLVWLSACTAELSQSGREPASLQVSEGSRGEDNSETQNRHIRRNLKPLASHRLSAADAKKDQAEVNGTYQFILGQLFSNEGRSDEAAQAFERSKDLDPKAAPVYLALSQEYLKKGWVSEGIDLLRKAIELDPKNRDAKSLLANMLSSAKKYGEAYVLLEEISKEDPDDEESKLLLVLLDIELKNPVKAEARLKKMTIENSESALAFFYLGRLSQERGKFNDALSYYKKSIELRSGFVQAGTYLGALQEETGDKNGALETYAWLAAQTDSPSIHRKLGQLHLEKNQFEQALLSFENYERLEPGELSNKVRLGLLYMQLKKSDAAIAMFKTALKKNPDAETLRMYLASIYEQLSRESDAIEEYARIEGKDPKIRAEALKRQLFLLAKSRPVEALEIWKQEKSRAELNQTWTEDLYMAGILMYEAQNKYTEALNLVETAQKTYSESHGLLYVQGMIFEKAGNWKKAIEVMQKIIARDAKHASALNFVGYVWADRGIELNRAEQMLRRAMKLRPTDALVQDSLGWVLFKKKKYNDAKAVLTHAHASEPKESIIAEHLADVLVKLGEFDEAKRLYELAIKLGPDTKEAREHLGQKVAALERGTPLDPCQARGKTVLARTLINSECNTARMQQPETRSPSASAQD